MIYNNISNKYIAVVRNPIKKVDVIYAHEIDGVRLQWTLEK